MQPASHTDTAVRPWQFHRPADTFTAKAALQAARALVSASLWALAMRRHGAASQRCKSCSGTLLHILVMGLHTWRLAHLAACVTQFKHTTAHNSQLWANMHILHQRLASASLPEDFMVDREGQMSRSFKDHMCELRDMGLLQRQTLDHRPVTQKRVSFSQQTACHIQHP